MVFCNRLLKKINYHVRWITILILIDGFLQYLVEEVVTPGYSNHNPYFNRWFSAIENWSGHELLWWYHNPYFNRWFSAIIWIKTNLWHIMYHNPYFNRWFSAICVWNYIQLHKLNHNPYFNRWFSAIPEAIKGHCNVQKSQSLF